MPVSSAKLFFCTSKMYTKADKKPTMRNRSAGAVLDDLSKSDPDRTFAIVSRGNEVPDGFYEFKIKYLAQAVNYTSWWIDKTIGRCSNSEIVSYMGANDIRYVIFVLACNKTGYTVS
jgi:hypothetical protein